METGYPFSPKHEEKLKRKSKIYSHKKIKLSLLNKYYINRGALRVLPCYLINKQHFVQARLPNDILYILAAQRAA